jgi:hypothetical protein
MASAPLSAQSRRAVLIDIDGLRRDTFEQTWRERPLPTLKRIFESALWFRHAVTVMPSVTMAAQASIATGALPARHGVPGNRWYDRESGRLVDYFSSFGATCIYGYTILGGDTCVDGLGNSHLQAPTLYEAAASRGFSSMVSYSQYWKGATRSATPSVAEARAFLPGNRLSPRAFDTQMAARVVADLSANGLPAILTVYFAGADSLAHDDGIAVQPGYLAEVVDPLLGRILETIAALDPDWRAHTLFILTSDHGRTAAADHPEDETLLRDLAAALPPGSHVADKDAIAYVYLEKPDASVAAMLEKKFPSTVASVRPRAPEDPARSGDLVVTLRPGHYFGNEGKGSHHGAATPDDLNVPLVVAMPGAKPGDSPSTVSVTRIARTIADFIGFPMESAAPALPIPREGAK